MGERGGGSHASKIFEIARDGVISSEQNLFGKTKLKMPYESMRDMVGSDPQRFKVLKKGSRRTVPVLPRASISLSMVQSKGCGGIVAASLG